MKYLVVPFKASITQNDSGNTAANQLQTLINQHAEQGWEYVRLESIVTTVAPENGCFGFGAKPGYTTSVEVVVFKQ
ncbi:MAG: DUF4177 domain-containing protein [Tannerellaceae bacterium]|nr:DUF4177 domain-containing protein [Tannerellaceae bacterium]